MIFQKALSPGQVRMLVEGNGDTVAGFVLRAGDVVGAMAPAALYQAHGLGFPGSPFDPNAEYLDVLRFSEPLRLYVHTPVAPSFVDRRPFTGTGFTSWEGGGVAPLYFLDEARIPAGAELWRIRADRPEELIAVYLDVAAGWAVIEGSGLRNPVARTPETIIGWGAVWGGYGFSADLIKENSSVALASRQEPPAALTGFTRTARGCWRREVPVAELEDLYEMYATCRWSGQPFRITAVAHGGDGQRHFRLFYIGHNADVAESLGLNKGDAGVYWAVVPEAQVTDVQVIQNQLQGLLPNG